MCCPECFPVVFGRRVVVVEGCPPEKQKKLNKNKQKLLFMFETICLWVRKHIAFLVFLFTAKILNTFPTVVIFQVSWNTKCQNTCVYLVVRLYVCSVYSNWTSGNVAFRHQNERSVRFKCISTFLSGKIVRGKIVW